ncbi:hypothetical protein CPC08DRAFT_710069 [Agrocybe pediades]|nr:hypothetical protein CPC08DRAFT_710069 [Agrocybe pediades]
MPSYMTLASVVIFAFASYQSTLAAPFASPQATNQVDNTYASQGGQSFGGSVSHDANSSKSILNGGSLLKLFSDNAASAGKVDSNASPPISNAAVSASGAGKKIDNSVGNAYSAPGGTSEGGSVNNASDGLIELFTGNAGSSASAESNSGNIAAAKKGSAKQRITRFIRLRLD